MQLDKAEFRATLARASAKTGRRAAQRSFVVLGNASPRSLQPPLRLLPSRCVGCPRVARSSGIATPLCAPLVARL